MENETLCRRNIALALNHSCWLRAQMLNKCGLMNERVNKGTKEVDFLCVRWRLLPNLEWTHPAIINLMESR